MLIQRGIITLETILCANLIKVFFFLTPGEMAQVIRAHAVLAADPGAVPSTHPVARDCL